MQKLAEYIVRPTRRLYDPSSELGPSLFTVNQKYYCSRTDFEVKNRRHKTLKCSLFHHNVDEGTCHPLIVFCHGNSGNRTYSYEIVSRMLKLQISVLTFDFAGCGMSEGKFVFQGFFEQFDIEDVLEYALETFSCIDPQKIGIWGRSMGAIAALLFASHNNTASCIIVDSPFKDFSDILNEYMTRLKIIPNIFAKYISSKLRANILHTCGFDFEELKPIETIATCKTPALFHHTKDDKIVPNYHSKDLFEAYPAEKEYLETEGGHNSERQEEYYDSVLKFIHKIFARKKTSDNSFMRCSTLQPRKNLGEQDCTEIFEYELEKQNVKKAKKSSYDSHEILRMSNFQPIINSGEKDSVEVIDGEVDKESNPFPPKNLLGDREMRNSTLQPCKNLGEQDCIEMPDHELEQDDEIQEEDEEDDADVTVKKEFTVLRKQDDAEDADEVMNREIEHESEILLKQFTEEDYSFFENASRHLNHAGANEEDETQQLNFEIEQIQEQEEEHEKEQEYQNQSSYSEESQYARIESEDLSHDLSKALSEPDRVATLKPWKIVRRTSANNSLIKGQ